MPNWCANRLRISGPTEDLVRFQKEAVGFSPWHPSEPADEPAALNFHSLVPIPPDVLAAGYGTSGCDWEWQYWGCKWGAVHVTMVDEWEGGALYEFDTAWSPPLPFLKLVSKAWPTLVFVMDYEEPLDGFKGLAQAKAGVLKDFSIEI